MKKAFIFLSSVLISTFMFAGDSEYANNITCVDSIESTLVMYSCQDFAIDVVAGFEAANPSLSSNELVELGMFFEAYCYSGGF